MIKKIFALLLVSILLFSCGKKGDPVYKEKNQNSKMNLITCVDLSLTTAT